MLIRTAILSDVPRLAEVHVSSWRAAYTGHMPSKVLNNISIKQRAEDWQQWISNPGPGTTYIIEEKKELVGFCVFGPTRDDDMMKENIGEILSLNIHPEYWRCGYGKYLCTRVLHEAQQRQWKSLTLWTLNPNVA